MMKFMNRQQNISWIDSLLEHPLANGAAISIICFLAISFLFHIAEWLGGIGMIAFAIADGIAIRFAYNSLKEGLHEELKLFAAFAIVSSISIIWTFVVGYTPEYGILIGILAGIDAIFFVYIAWASFRKQNTRYGALSVIICLLLFSFSFLVLPSIKSFTGQNKTNEVTAKPQNSNSVENTHWKGAWIGNIPAYFAFKENGIVIAQFGNKQRTGTYTQHGRYVTVAINGGEGTLDFSLHGDKLTLYMASGNSTGSYTFTQY